MYGDRLAAPLCAAELATPSLCYQNAGDCCGTCAEVCLDIPGCEFGDKARWCSGITANQCYEASTAETCCKTCADFRRGPDACKFGDAIAGCTTSDCGDPSRAPSCCETCMMNIASLTALNSMSQCLHQDAFWCSTIDKEDCYNHYYTCCNTCKKLKEYAGCEYGDEYEWCSPDDCSDERLRKKCCRTCGVNSLTSCRDDASWCTTLAGSYCYDERTRATCCRRCSDLRRGPPGCEYGDRGTFCGTTKAYQCYDKSYAKDCCRMCSEMLNGPVGCEFGNRMPNCMDADCRSPEMARKCCRSCTNMNLILPQPQPLVVLGGQPAPLFAVPPPAQPIQGKTQLNVETEAVEPTILLGEPVVAVMDTEQAIVQKNEQEEPCLDRAKWCFSVKPHECYYESTKNICCAACASLYISELSQEGCQYGDKYDWCARAYCNSYQNQLSCCGTCKPAANKNSIILKSMKPDPQCKDTARWCTHGLHSAYCYNEETRNKTCCYSCGGKATKIPGCEYGDKKTWCDNRPYSDCAMPDVRENCCIKCRDYEP